MSRHKIVPGGDPSNNTRATRRSITNGGSPSGAQIVPGGDPNKPRTPPERALLRGTSCPGSPSGALSLPLVLVSAFLLGAFVSAAFGESWLRLACTGGLVAFLALVIWCIRWMLCSRRSPFALAVSVRLEPDHQATPEGRAIAALSAVRFRSDRAWVDVIDELEQQMSDEREGPP